MELVLVSGPVYVLYFLAQSRYMSLDARYNVSNAYVVQNLCIKFRNLNIKQNLNYLSSYNRVSISSLTINFQ
jgi:hypothetical protein